MYLLTLLPLHAHPFASLCRIYILAHLLASVLACSIFAFVSGWGPLMPFQSYKELNISWPEALWMWVTGECCVPFFGRGGVSNVCVYFVLGGCYFAISSALGEGGGVQGRKATVQAAKCSRRCGRGWGPSTEISGQRPASASAGLSPARSQTHC